MERVIQTTADGSPTIAIPAMSVTYHSTHGAIQESMHVFINAALRYHSSPTSVLEMGFGTGLNALLTLAFATGPVYYESLEQFPVEPALSDSLDYPTRMNRPDLKDCFTKLHHAPWNEAINISDNFQLFKRQTRLQDYQPQQTFDIIYFDAFAPNTQPDLWTPAIFSKLYEAQTEQGLLVTYCSKGDVRRAMMAAGYRVEKIPGPPGKREMLRARKIS